MTEIPDKEPPCDLEQRFALKEAIVRLRDEVSLAWRSADYPYANVFADDLDAALNEIDRLMLVNGQIAKMLCDSEDRLEASRTSERVPREELTK